MAETRGITVKIPVELHSQVKAEQETLGITMNQYIENVLTEHFTMERKKRIWDLQERWHFRYRRICSRE